MRNKQSTGTTSSLPIVAERRGRLINRKLAIIEQAVELIAKGDPAADLAAEWKKDPKGFLDWLSKQVQEPASNEKASNINNLFLLAAKQVAQLPIVDAEAVPVEAGVQPGYSTDEPTDW